MTDMTTRKGSPPPMVACTCPLKCFRSPDELEEKGQGETLTRLCKTPWTQCQSVNRHGDSQLLLDLDTE